MTTIYHESLRPQFHYTTRENWLNDPNGLVYYKGTYHLFHQYCPGSLDQRFELSSWNHATSTDLVHWTEHGPVIVPDEYGFIWSGSAVVDWNNTSGLSVNGEPPLVAFFTHGDQKENRCVQCIAYSNDEGMTWTKYAGNPVIPHIVADNRDPKVIWDAPSNQWVMVLYLDGNDFALFGSQDLLHWKELSRLVIKGDAECPDFFSLPLDGDDANRKYVIMGANQRYMVGSFDGTRFLPETELLEWAEARNIYAAQTWSDAPDGRRIQICWMGGARYPGMPFNQQMTFPAEFSLRTTPEGVRLCRMPVREIELLQQNKRELKDIDLPIHWVYDAFREWADERIDTLDLEVVVEVGNSTSVDIILRNSPIRYMPKYEMLIADGGVGTKLPLRDGLLKLRILMDRTSLEIFGNDGEVFLTTCLLPHPEARGFSLVSIDEPIRLVSAIRYDLASIWP